MRHLFALLSLLIVGCKSALLNSRENPSLGHDVSPSRGSDDARDYMKRSPLINPDPSLDIPKPRRLANATRAYIQKARNLVKTAMQALAQHNKARLDNPLRNNYALESGTRSSLRLRSEDVAPLFNVTADIATAAALIAEADAYEEATNITLGRRGADHTALQTRASSYWLANKQHKGSWPFGNNDKDFAVFRNVADYGAAGNGITDDTEAIRRAVSAGKMCGPGCYNSTTKGAIIYFPPGVYLVSGTIETYYGTQFIGDPTDRPVIKAARSFVGLGVISTDKYVDNGGSGSDGNAEEWFINTGNFYRQIRSFVIDIRDTDPGAHVCALHYQVAQATSVQFVEFRAKTGTTQQAIFAENGSGGHMSDLVFTGGNFGIYGGNQQFTAQRLMFDGCTTAVQLIWDWGWAWKSIYIKNADVGFKLLSEDGVHNTGSILVVDSVFENVKKAILTFPAKGEKGDGTTGLTLDNIKFINTDMGVVDNAGTSYLDTKDNIDTFVLGRIYVDQNKDEALHTTFKTRRDESLVGNNPNDLPKRPFYERAKPQYETTSSSAVRNIKSNCAGDGKADDTKCIQDALNRATSSDIVYFDAGSYMISDTINIPSGLRIVGENWAQLVAFGKSFEIAKHPRPLVRVGDKGQRGNVEMQDLIFTSRGPTAGVVFVEWNLKSEGPASAGMWDCHVRVGGAVGTELTVKECPAGSINDKCRAGSALMHITPSGSGYFEDVWLWVADQNNAQFLLPRGLLVESTHPTWLYGTASEHATFYQYEFYNAQLVHASMIQTESPYYQPLPSPPEPMKDAVGAMPGDPAYKCSDGETCDSSWALRILNSSDIMIHGAGLYSWFDKYTQECLQTVNCQKSLIELRENHGGVRIHNLVTIGAVNMIEADGTLIKAADNQAVDFHPRWSQIAVFDPRQFTNPCTGEPEQTNPTLRDGKLEIAVPEEGQNTYLTLVNGTPHKFRFLGQNNWQMENWDKQWIDIPAGESAQFDIWYLQGAGISDEDSAGEAYYQLEGTTRTFYVSTDYVEGMKPPLRTRIVYHSLPTMDFGPSGTLDLGMPTKYDGVAQSWILTGSDNYGFIGSKAPRHDAGMSTIDGRTALADWANTQTQWLDIYGQLTDSAYGANGLEVEEAIKQINRFMTDYPGELVILDVNDETAFDTDHREKDRYKRLTEEQWRPIWAEFRDSISKPCRGFGDSNLAERTINEYIGDGQGCVLTVVRTNPAPEPDSDKGFYLVGQLERYNQYSGTDDYNRMRSDQISRLKANRRLGREGDAETQDGMHVLSWTMTLSPFDAITSLATRASAVVGSLFWDAHHQFTPFSYPNVLYVDFIGALWQLEHGLTQEEYMEQTDSHIAALAMAVNLQIASQNCYVGGGKLKGRGLGASNATSCLWEDVAAH